MKLPIIALMLALSPAGSAAAAAPQAATPPQPSAGAAPQTPAPAADLKPPAPDIPGWARVSFFANGSSSTGSDGGGNSFSEMVTSVTAQAPVHQHAGVDYGLDVRFGAYPSAAARQNRVSIYNAFLGYQANNRRFAVKVGQVWLNDLGGLGALGGVVAETRREQAAVGGYVRVGAFGGLEPRILQAGYVTDVQKYGGYVVFEGRSGMRRHVAGYVNIRNSGTTERSVLTFANFLPLGGNKVFIYQAGEYDLTGPAGLGAGGLSYFFANVRGAATRRVELQATYHRGRSIDARSITLDQINGRPVSPKSLDGFLYESVGGRVTVEVVQRVRVFAGYAVDRNNAGDASNGRLQLGVWASDLAHTGIDVNVTDWRTIQAGVTQFDSWYISVGRSLWPRVYVNGDFSSSLSRLRFATAASATSPGFTLESRPRTKRYAVSATARVYRPASILFTFERLADPSYTEQRVLSGITYRF